MKKYIVSSLIVLLLGTVQAAQLTGALRINTDTTGTNTKSSAITIPAQTNLLAGSVTVSNLTASALVGTDSGSKLATVNLSGAVTTSSGFVTTLTTNQSQQKHWIRVGTTNLGVFDSLTFWPGSNITITTTNGTGNTNIDVVITGTGGGGGGFGGVIKMGGADTGSNPTSGGFTLYSGGTVFSVPSSTYDNQKIYVPANGTIKKLFVRVRVSGTLGTTESVVHKISINGAAGTGTGVSLTYDTVNNIGSSTESISVSAGDYIALVFTTPTWSTPPTTVFWESWAYIE